MEKKKTDILNDSDCGQIKYVEFHKDLLLDHFSLLTYIYIYNFIK